MTRHDLFTDLLTSLQVPHTAGYSMRRYDEMPFQSLFGLNKLLEEYGVESLGLRFDDPGKMRSLPRPYVAATTDGVCLVATEKDLEAAMPRLTGTVLCVYPRADACEPDCMGHRIGEEGDSVKPWLLLLAVATLLIYAIADNHIFSSLTATLLFAINAAGLFFSYLLILKQLHIHSHIAERVCGVIQREGCSKVLATGASSFFGLFHWSEVGASYFGISLITLVAFPSAWPMLVAVNLCCLPFTFWSVWYQRTRAKAWCTLCLSVQCLLWLQFLCYLFGGWIRAAWPLSASIIPLCAAYLTALLIINHLLRPQMEEEDE